MLKRVRIIGDYQFGQDAGAALFPDSVTFVLSSTGRVSQVMDNNIRIATLRSYDGLFTLSKLGAIRLHKHFARPKLRVVVNSDAASFVGSGKTAFARHIVDVDLELRANDEVLLVDESDKLLATGQALLSPKEMLTFEKGVAVKVRHGFLKAEAQNCM
ncbi:MAG TPA: PUA domain-containing protein [Candidatus Acidoferrales bacterium]|nr:PUA domain-containing protein [Candidatus Acidoferrales bacterium]